MKVIFLDYDGVIIIPPYKENGDSDIPEELWDKEWHRKANPECLKQLTRILEETGAKIVVSSSWRLGARGRWEGILGDLVPETIGITTEFWLRTRGLEIKDWLNANKVDKYVILDDDSDMLEGQKPYFVKTEFFDGGLTKEKADEAIRLLQD